MDNDRNKIREMRCLQMRVRQEFFMKKICLSGFIILISACSSPKDATKENFLKALKESNSTTLVNQNRSMEEGNVCSLNFHKSTFNPSSYYISAIASPDGYRVVQGWFTPDDAQENLAKLEALHAAGILEREVKPAQVSRGWKNESGEKILTLTYPLSEQGKKLFQPGGIDNLYISYCQPSIEEVLSFSEPVPMNGEVRSKVKYSYSVVGFESWAKNPQVIAAFPNVKHDFESLSNPQGGSTDVLLTSEGWITHQAWSSRGQSEKVSDRLDLPPMVPH
jgi:hypothetical protein